VSFPGDERGDESAPEQPDSEPSGIPTDADAGPEAAAPTPEPDAEASGEGDDSAAVPEEPASKPEDSVTEAEAEPGQKPAQPDEAAKSTKAKDVAPGADLDPIAITPERELTAEERARVEAEAEERARREAEATADTGAEEAVPERRETVSIPADARIRATGKRKRSVARVILRSGDGTMSINERTFENYFPREYHRTLARQPLVAAGYDSSVDVWVRVHGGGIGGQAGAVRHGIARALCEVDPELRGELKRRGMLTRDAREKERRKAGLKKARKRPQFSKR
jgi:small subunit ribosomal protein S9